MLSLNLNSGALAAVREAPAPPEAVFDPGGRKIVVKKGDSVKIGSPLAVCEASLAGDLHSSVAGEVIEAGPGLIVVRNSGSADAVEAKIPSSGGPASALSALGIDASAFKPSGTLVVNALNHEPGVTVREQLLKDKLDLISAGIAALRKIVSPSDVVVAAGMGFSSTVQGARVVGIKPVYPAGVDELVAFAVTGSEKPGSALVVGADDVAALGFAVTSGLPYTSRLVSIGNANWTVKIGTRIRDLASALPKAPEDGDRVILGGPMRGFAQYSLDAPVRKDTAAVTVVAKGAFAPVTSDACTNCGECTRRCPARLQASLLGRFAEFRLFEEVKKLHIDACFECGLCAFWCPARRPMLHYMRYAKEELKKIAECLAAQEKAVICDTVDKECEELPVQKCPEGKPGEGKQV